MTILLGKYAGSQGSKLHKKDTHTYIAYAQWPDKSTWSTSGSKLSEVSEDIKKILNIRKRNKNRWFK